MLLFYIPVSCLQGQCFGCKSSFCAFAVKCKLFRCSAQRPSCPVLLLITTLTAPITFNGSSLFRRDCANCLAQLFPSPSSILSCHLCINDGRDVLPSCYDTLSCCLRLSSPREMWNYLQSTIPQSNPFMLSCTADSVEPWKQSFDNHLLVAAWQGLVRHHSVLSATFRSCLILRHMDYHNNYRSFWVVQLLFWSDLKKYTWYWKGPQEGTILDSVMRN